MLNVSSWSIRNPIPAVMLFVLLTLAGLMLLLVIPSYNPELLRA